MCILTSSRLHCSLSCVCVFVCVGEMEKEELFHEICCREQEEYMNTHNVNELWCH